MKSQGYPTRLSDTELLRLWSLNQTTKVASSDAIIKEDITTVQKTSQGTSQCHLSSRFSGIRISSLSLLCPDLCAPVVLLVRGPAIWLRVTMIYKSLTNEIRNGGRRSLIVSNLLRRVRQSVRTECTPQCVHSASWDYVCHHPRAVDGLSEVYNNVLHLRTCYQVNFDNCNSLMTANSQYLPLSNWA